MKLSLVLFDRINPRQRRSLGYASYRLAVRLHQAGRLGQLICLACTPDVELPRERITTLADGRGRALAFELLGRVGRRFPVLPFRRLQEALFDGFARRNLQAGPDRLLFCSRPLVPATVAAARAAGMPVWVQSSVPHPLHNYAVVRHEELRLGLAGSSAYTDLRRAEAISRVLAAADKVVTLAPEIGAFTYGTYLQFLPADRLLALRDYFSIDQAEFDQVIAAREARPAGPGLTFLHLSHVNLIKGVQYLLEAWRLATDRGLAGCRLVIAGRLDKDTRRLFDARFRGLAGVEFAGYVPDIAGAMAAADAFVSCSIADAGPATILEAMAAGLPVVASRNCGFASLVEDGVSGWTYAYNDVEALAGILLRLAADPAATRDLGRNARRGLGASSIDRYGDEILRHLDAVAGGLR